MQNPLIRHIVSRAPLNRKDFLVTALVLLTAGNAIVFAVELLLWDTILFLPVGLALELFFFYCCFSFASRRLDAAGSEFFGNAGRIVFFALLFVIAVFGPRGFLGSDLFFALEAVFLLSLTLFPDKPVSGTGWVRNATGRYDKPAPEAAPLAEAAPPAGTAPPEE